MAPPQTLTPQDWTEVVSPPKEIAEAVAALVPDTKGEPLTTAQLADLSAAIAEREEIWRPMVVSDPERRRYRMLFEDERLDVWVIMWMPGQGTGYHDHAVSGVGVAGAEGMAIEKQMTLPYGHTEVEIRPGVRREGPAGYIHSVAHGEGAPAITIHSYSPPLMEVGQYRVDDDGILRREIEHGRRELLDNTIAEIAPEIV
jgi:predicted metal-dependent enzyme (double-stranded beta helix superfamily)